MRMESAITILWPNPLKSTGTDSSKTKVGPVTTARKAVRARLNSHITPTPKDQIETKVHKRKKMISSGKKPTRPT